MKKETKMINENHMIKVICEENGIVMAYLDESGPHAPSRDEIVKLARVIAKAYGCNPDDEYEYHIEWPFT